MAALFRVEPVEVARRQADSSSFLLHTDAGRMLTLVYRFWLVHGPDGITVVDTGLTAQEAARRGIQVECGLQEALAPYGIGPDDVGTLILTHLHWDHACAVDVLPNATVWLQRAEADFFNHPLRAHPAIDRYFGRHDVIRDLLGAPRLTLVAGETELPNGLRLVPLGGHTPGLQGIVLPTEDGRAVITSDAVPFNRNYTDDLPNGILQDLGQSIASLDRIRALRPDVIYTGHDPIPLLRTGESF